MRSSKDVNKISSDRSIIIFNSVGHATSFICGEKNKIRGLMLPAANVRLADSGRATIEDFNPKIED